MTEAESMVFVTVAPAKPKFKRGKLKQRGGALKKKAHAAAPTSDGTDAGAGAESSDGAVTPPALPDQALVEGFLQLVEATKGGGVRSNEEKKKRVYVDPSTVGTA